MADRHLEVYSLQILLKSGMIRESSAYASADEKTGEKRCVDYSVLNKITVKDPCLWCQTY